MTLCMRRLGAIAMMLLVASLPLSTTGTTASASTESRSAETPAELLATVQAEGDRLCDITTDAQAVALFSARLAGPLKLTGLPAVQGHSPRVDHPLPTE